MRTRLAQAEQGIPDAVRAVRAAQRAEYAAQGLHRRLTLDEVLQDGIRAHPTTTVTFHSGVRTPVTVTLADLYRRGVRAAAGLARLGLGPGDALAVQLPNWVELAVTYYAAARLGLVLVPIVPMYGAAELGFILRDSKARAVVLPTSWRSTDYFGNLERVGDLPELRAAVAVGQDQPSGAIAWESLEVGDDPGGPAAVGDPDDLCIVIYTSGTTADPKGVQHSHDSVAAEMRWSPTPPFGKPGTVSLQPFPSGHTAGVIALLGPAVHGSDTILMDAWDPEAAGELIARRGVTAMAGTPYFITTLLDVSEREGWKPTRSIRDVVTGGAGVPPVLVERAEEAGWTVTRVYGATEQPSVTGARPTDPLSLRATTDGVPLTGNAIAIVDDKGNPVPPGDDGEIVVSGPDQFIGYTDVDLNVEAFTATGLFRTGDIGHIDSAGALVVTDRKKDIIIRGGENISSRNVEDVLSRHQSVVEAAVTGVPDDRYGERVCAFVIIRPGQSLNLDDVRRHFQLLGVATQKTPERLEIVTSFPRTAAGKVKKHELRRLASSRAVPDAVT